MRVRSQGFRYRIRERRSSSYIDIFGKPKRDDELVCRETADALLGSGCGCTRVSERKGGADGEVLYWQAGARIRGVRAYT